MTNSQNDIDTSGADTAEEDPTYTFLPRMIEEQGRSIGAVLRGRLSDGAQAKLEGNGKDMPYKALRKLFKDSCAGQEGYLSPQHPVLETVLRMLLTAKSDSLPLSDIHDRVSDLWLTSTWPRHINLEAMKRLLDRAAYYGIVRA